MIKPEYMDILSTLIDKRRLKHSVNVSKYACKLAERYGVDVKKAELTGMIHDCAKCLPYENMLEMCKKYNYEPDDISIRSRALLHAPLGAYMAADVFGIKDTEILNAIRCHTTGKKGMTLLEKVICLADHIEPLRNYTGVGEIRKCAQADIDKALLMAFESSINHVIKKGGLLHPASIDARNDMMLAVREQKPKFKKEESD